MQLCMPMTLPMAVATAMMTRRMMLHVDFLFRFSIRDKVLMDDAIKKVWYCASSCVKSYFRCHFAVGAD